MKMFLITLLFAFTASAQVTTSDSIQIGKPGSAANKEIKFGAGRGAKPGIRYNTTNSKLEFSNDASIFKALGSGSGSGAGINLLTNPGFEDGITSNWVTSGTPLVAVTSGANLLFDLISASWTPTAAAHFFESSPIVIPNGLYGAACMVEVFYQGADANSYLTVFNSSTEIIPATARAVLNNTTGVKKAKVYFDCPSSGSLKLRVQSTAATAIGYFDKAHLGQADFAQSKQPQYLGDVTFSTTGSHTINTTALADVLIGVSKIYTGALLAPTGNRVGVTLTNLQPGRYVVKASGINLATSSAISNLRPVTSFSSNDFNNCGVLTAGGNSQNILDGAGAADFSCEFSITSQTSSKEIYLRAYTNIVAAGISLNVNSLATSLISVYFYPSGNDTIVNSKCVKPLDCINEFSATIDTNGVVVSENADWISGNCTTPQVGQKICTYVPGVFNSAIPSCSMTIIAQNQYPIVESNTGSGITYGTFNFSNVRSNSAVYLSCQKNGADYKARETIQGFFSNNVSTTTSNTKIISASFGQAAVNTVCTTSPCGLFNASPEILQVTRSVVGGYSVTFQAGTFTVKPKCFYSLFNGINQLTLVSSESLTSSSMNISISNTGAGADAAVNIMCVGN